MLNSDFYLNPQGREIVKITMMVQDITKYYCTLAHAWNICCDLCFVWQSINVCTMKWCTVHMFLTLPMIVVSINRCCEGGLSWYGSGNHTLSHAPKADELKEAHQEAEESKVNILKDWRKESKEFD